MKSKITINLLLLCFLSSFFVSCSSSDLSKRYEKKLEALKSAIQVFKDGKYEKAIIELNKYHNNYDSTYYDYETVALIVESYRKLGKPDSGKIFYENCINEIKKTVNSSNNYRRYMSLALEDLSKWFQKYPIFPAELKFENGFTYTDELPQPIGGLSAINNKISNDEKLNGRVYAMALIDEKGKVIDCYIIKSFNEIVNQRVIDAIKSTNFTSPKRKGRIAKTWVSIPILFS
jgi:TonB family protein